jgi:hypothetical protein
MTLAPRWWLALAACALSCARGGEGYNVSEPVMGDSGVAVTIVANGLDSPLFVASASYGTVPSSTPLSST